MDPFGKGFTCNKVCSPWNYLIVFSPSFAYNIDPDPLCIREISGMVESDQSGVDPMMLKDRFDGIKKLILRINIIDLGS